MLLLTFHMRLRHIHVEVLQEQRRVHAKLDILQGTLDLMVLRTLSTLGSLHGYGIARRIEQVSGDHVILNQGTIYTSLVRLEQRGWIRTKWGVSEKNRRAKFYSITKAGEKQLVAETENWERMAAVMGRVLASEGGEP
jgi:PadR family transcriptional regulator PadR